MYIYIHIQDTCAGIHIHIYTHIYILWVLFLRRTLTILARNDLELKFMAQREGEREIYFKELAHMMWKLTSSRFVGRTGNRQVLML